MTSLRLVHPSTPRATSVEVLRAIRDGGLVVGMRLDVLDALGEIGPATGMEVEEHLRRPGDRARGSRHKRLPELRDVGCVVECGSRPCRITGRLATTWALSGNLPREAPTRTVPLATRLAAAEREIEQLRDENRSQRIEIALLRSREML